MRFAEENKTEALSNEQSGELYNNDFELRDKLETIKKELEKSPEVIELSKQVDVKSPNSILQFGSKPAEEISKFSDKILSSIKTSSIESSSVMLQDLSKLMSRFDKEELMDKDRGFFGKLFYNSQKAVEKLLSKYQTLGREIDRIYKQISDYKNELSKTNDMLDEMFVQNLEYYKQLEKYVIACNMVINELQTEDLPYYSEKAKSGDPSDALELEAVNNAIEMLKNRAYDFEMAKMVAMQTAPQIRIIQKGNFKLIGKIHSAFIITIPIFKNGLIQAVTLKRQNLVADSMAALDRTTNELLLKNAQNLKNQSIEIAKLSNSSAINIDTLENTWKAIVEGINETKRIEDENRAAREEGMKKINNMQIEFMKKIH